MKSTWSGERFQVRGDGIWLLAILGYLLLFHLRILLDSAHFPFDYEGYHYPLLYHGFKNLKAGIFPFWDPTIYSGMPFVHNLQASLFYPVHLLLFAALILMGADFTLYVMQYLNIFHFFLGGMGFFYLLKDLGFSQRLSFLGSLLLAANGFLLGQSQHLGVIETAAWVPFGLLLLRRTIRTGKAIYAYLLGAVLSLMLLIGFLPELFSFLVVGGVYAIFLILRSSPPRLAGAAHLGTALILFAAITAVAYFPALEYYRFSIPLDLHGGLPPSVLLTALMPDFFSARNLETFWGPADPTVCFFYGGIILPLFLPLGFKLRRQGLGFYKALFLTTLLLCFRPFSEFLKIPFQALPAVGALFRPVNFLVYFVVSAIVVALRGFEAVDSARYAWRAALFYLGAVVIAVLMTWQLTGRQVWSNGLSVLPLLTAVWAIPTVFRRHWKAALGLFLLLDVSALNSNLFFHSFPGPSNTLGPNYVDVSNSEIIKFFQSDPEIFRISVDQERMGGPWNTAFRVWDLETITGFDPLLSRQYLDFLRQDITWSTNRTFHVGNLDSEALRFLNVKYYLTINPEPRVHPDFELVKDGFYKVYRYRKFTPRYLVLVSQNVQDRGDGRNLQLGEIPPQAVPVRVLEYSTNSRTLEARSPAAGAVLFMSEISYPGWKVFVDGRETTPLQVNDLFLAARLSEGVHTVKLVFEPRSFKPGALVSALGVLALVVLLAVESLRG